uniref:glutathione transferase n=1 Tax=Bionectria ochroleuca TaxID=29856 RepID=A0A8H7TNM8_BIOOC
MSPTVLGTVTSTRTQKVLLTLEELGIKYDLELIDLGKGQHQSSEYVKKHHPFAKVPVFQDGEVKIFESRAITRYLVATTNNSPLVPAFDDTKALATFEQAASIEQAYFEPAVSALGFELIFKKLFKLGETNQATVDQQLALLKTTLDYYSHILDRQHYLAGNTYTLVDLFHVPWIGFLRDRLLLGELIDSRKNVAAWAERISQREASKMVAAKVARH